MGVLSGHPFFRARLRADELRRQGASDACCGVASQAGIPACSWPYSSRPYAPSPVVYRGGVQLALTQCDKIELGNQAGHIR